MIFVFLIFLLESLDGDFMFFIETLFIILGKKFLLGRIVCLLKGIIIFVF